LTLNISEQKERIAEDEMMRLNYERKVTVLLHQWDKLISKLRNRVQRDAKEEDKEENQGKNEEGGDVKRIKIAAAVAAAALVAVRLPAQRRQQ
jgi:hypothetical protein